MPAYFEKFFRVLTCQIIKEFPTLNVGYSWLSKCFFTKCDLLKDRPGLYVPHLDYIGHRTRQGI